MIAFALLSFRMGSVSERALHMKIDELVFAMKGARDEIAGIECKTEEELEALRRTGDMAENFLEARQKG